ncbi:MAG: MBL fold metallo-hydrolase [Anaerotruncus sp.]|nr:MBL fold metallo-hydrolase [Anaerotruncus sp.]
MYELVPLSDRCYAIDCPAKIGVYLTSPTDTYLIDSGNDKDAGRKVRQILEQNHWQLRGILNTHSNADHIGGNRYLQNQTGCKIFSAGIEAAFTQHPILEPSFLYGGYPCKDLRHKFLLAQQSDVSDFRDEAFPKEIEVIPLHGHFFDMVGFRTPEQIVFLADCVSSQATLEKYAVSFIYDVDAYLQTLDAVEKMQAKLFVPSHAEITADIKPLVQYNRSKVFEIADFIRSACAEPIIFEQLLQRLFERYRLTMNFEQYVLIGSTVRSYLSWLKDQGQVDAMFEQNLLRWRRVD